MDFTSPLVEIAKDQYPIMRDLKPTDPKMKMKPLERYFGCLVEGQTFGESCMFGDDSSAIKYKPRFYTPIALTDCYYLTLSCENLKEVVDQREQYI